MEAAARRPAWKTLLAFAIIYFVWGSTYLAIRVGVREVPPFLLAAMRFLVAGFVVYGWMMARGERSPTRRQWTSASLLAVLIFVLDYGLVFWAEQRVPSGITAVMMATIPAFMALSEIIFLRTQRLRVRLALALLIGLAGVAVPDEPLVEPRRGANRPGGRGGADRCIDELVGIVGAHAQAAAAAFQSHELGGADARWRRVSGSHLDRAG